MSSSLIARYTYGNQTLPDLVIHQIGVTEELQWLAREQIKIQKTTSEITRRNFEGAQIISSEIDQQTHKLERATEQFASNVSASVLFAADQISYAIDILGDHICADLDEIKWYLAQQNEVLDQILRVLRQSRNNEANQLVQQGIRLCINGEYEDAEERFKKAFKKDKTHYQVLMNLGFIEIRKDNAAAAHGFFKKAFSVPGNIGPFYQAKTLRAIAQLYYTEQTKQGYRDASSHAEQALKLNAANDPEDIFRAGVYGALAEDTPLALKRLEEAITLKPELVAKTAVEPDLQAIKKDVLALLSKIANAAKNKATKLLLEVRKQLTATLTHKEHKQYSDLIPLVENHLKKAETLLHKPSYSDCLHALTNLEIWQGRKRPRIGSDPVAKSRGVLVQRTRGISLCSE